MRNHRFLSPHQKHLLGIYGGVGPLAHVEFERTLLSKNVERGAKKDQDHPTWVLVNASSTPDRTKTLLEETFESKDYLIHYSQMLEKMGAEALFVICNTAHGYHKEVQKELSIPWVHLMDITAQYIRDQYPSLEKVAILATNGTLSVKLYHSALEEASLQSIAPEVGSKLQNSVMDAIYHPEFGIKATGASVDPRAIKNLVSAAKWCLEEGAEAIIAGCTEISVGLNPTIFPFVPIIDPLTIASDIFLDLSFGKKQPQEFMVNYEKNF